MDGLDARLTPANPAQAPDCHQGHKPAPKRRTTHQGENMNTLDGKTKEEA